MNILIVDDEPNARKTLSKILMAKGFEVEEAGTGSEAAASCRAKFFNLVLIDVRLPDMSGLEVLRVVRGINEDTIAIMMTGYASLDSSIEAMNKGAYSYLTKPLNMDAALTVIEKGFEKQRLAEALRISEESYRAIFESANDAIFIRDINTYEIVDANEKACEMFCYPREEIKGLSLGSLSTGSAQYPVEKLKSFYDKAAKEEPQLFEWLAKDKYGREFWVEISTKRTIIGGKYCVLSIARDITERKKAEAEITVLSNAFRAALDPILILDLEGKVINVNEAARRLFETEELGVSALDYAVPEDREKIIVAMQGLIAGSGVNTTEFTIVTKSGRRVSIEATGSLIRDANGKATGFVVVERDITERRRAEEVQQRLAAIVISSHDAIIGKTLDGIITSWNKGAEERYGYSAEEVIGQHISIIVPPDRAEEVPRFLAKVGRGEAVVDYESERVTKDGRRITVLLTISPIRDASRKIVGASVMAQDISVIKKAEEKAKQTAAEWQTTFDSIADLVSIQSKDFKLIRVNKAYADAVGMKMQDIIGRPCYEVVHNTSSYIENCPHHRTLETKKAVTQEVFEPRLNAYLEVSTSPIFDNDGEILGSVHIAKNITERKRAEDTLRQFVDRLSLATRAGGVGVWDYDVVNNKLIWDDQMYHLYGITPDKFGGAYEAWQAGLHPEDMQRGDNEIQMALRGEKEFDTEFRVIWPDGTIRNIRALAILQRDASGKPLRMIGTNWDITERKNKEELIESLNEQQRIILDASPALIFYKDKENRFIRVNEALAKANGLSKKEMEGKTVWDLYPREAAEHYWQDDKEVMAAGKPLLNIIEEMKTPLDTRWVQTDKVPYRNSKGEIVGIIGFTLDITERKKAEDALRESEEKYRNLVENASDQIFMVDEKYKMVSVNNAALIQFRKQPNEVMGKHLSELFPEEIATRNLKNLAEVFKTGKGISVEEELIFNGNKVFVSSSLNPIKNIAGKTTNVLGVVRDITERKRFEEMLKESEQKFRKLADLLPQTVCEIDLQGRFTYANKYGLEVHGYTWDEIEKSLNALDLFIPEQRDRAAQNISRVLLGQKFDDHEYSVLRNDGSTYPALIYTNAIVRNGQVVGIRALVVDITERKKIEQMKTDFVSFISHQLRTPVAGLMAYIDNMLEGITGELNDRQSEYLNEMRGVCARGNQLIADLLNISRLERGVISVNIQPTYLRDKVEMAVREYKTSIEEKGLALNINEVEQKVLVLADGDKLVEVLKNVIHNAYKFTKDGSISIEISSEGNKGVIKVRDTGIGMTEVAMKDLFKKEKVFGGAITAGGGAGLGLYIAKGFMKLQGGDIMVESVIGKGSTFIISLPRK